MGRDEVLKLLHAKLENHRDLSYAAAVARIGHDEVLEATGSSGTAYQIEIQVIWDGKPHGDVRVRGAIDDGGWRAFLPLSSDLVIAPDSV